MLELVRYVVDAAGVGVGGGSARVVRVFCLGAFLGLFVWLGLGGSVVWLGGIVSVGSLCE